MADESGQEGPKQDLTGEQTTSPAQQLSDALTDPPTTEGPEGKILGFKQVSVPLMNEGGGGTPQTIPLVDKLSADLTGEGAGEPNIDKAAARAAVGLGPQEPGAAQPDASTRTAGAPDVLPAHGVPPGKSQIQNITLLPKDFGENSGHGGTSGGTGGSTGGGGESTGGGTPTGGA